MHTRSALLLFLPLSACFWTPTNRSTASSDNPTINMLGFATKAGDPITFSARDNNTDLTVALAGGTTANTLPMWFSPNFFFWSYSLPQLPANYWAPQNPNLNGLNHSLGRIELFGNTASQGNMFSFSAAGEDCVFDKMDAGASPESAAQQCVDGTSLILFDNDGVGNGPPPTGWIPEFTTNAANNVTWQLGSYKVQGLDIQGLLCYPTWPVNGPPQPRRTMIVNHGGYGPINDCVLNDWCIDYAEKGWVVALSIYRGQTVNVTVPGQGVVTRTSGGNIELCLGEVTDVLRLTDLVRARQDTNDAEMLMWGHSHGGCVTTRAVEQGVAVKAAIAVAGPTNFTSWANWGAPIACILGAGVDPPPNDTGYCPALANPSCRFGPPADINLDARAYRWRSATHFAPDLKIRSTLADVKFLTIHGAVDPIVPPAQACELTNTVWGTGGKNWFVAAPGTPAPSGCGSVTWQPGTVPTGSWAAPQHFLLYNGYYHDIVVNKAGAPWAHFNDFITTHFGP